MYDGRNVLKRIGLGRIDVVVKSFKKPHIINRVDVYKRQGVMAPRPVTTTLFNSILMKSDNYLACSSIINNINKQITRIINRGAIYFLPLNKVIERYKMCIRDR